MYRVGREKESWKRDRGWLKIIDGLGVGSCVGGWWFFVFECVDRDKRK